MVVSARLLTSRLSRTPAKHGLTIPPNARYHPHTRKNRVCILWGNPPPPPGHPQGMPLQWYEHASQDDPSSIVGASLVGAHRHAR